MRIFHTKSGYTVSNILPGRSNVFLLSDGCKNILIDTSPGNKWEKLKKTLTSLNIRKIHYLILTHTHYDHAGNSAKLKSEYEAIIIVNKREAEYLENGKTSLVNGTVLFTRLIVKKLFPILAPKLNYEPCQPDILVDQRFDLFDFGFNAYILHTPGHSPGSQSVIIDDEIALAGDSMFGVFPGSIFPPFADKEDQLITSWGKLLETNCHSFFPSHGTPNKRELVQREYKKRSIS
jgi:hydroxyacylglutathione hydrolase